MTALERNIMEEGTKIDWDTFSLGTAVVKFNLPIEFVDAINKAYDENSKNLKPHNDQLAGKITEENAVDDILTDEMKNVFSWCFQNYLNIAKVKSQYNTFLAQAWINEMKSGEYNPIHYHTSPNTDVGLSSVLMLKRPDWYGVEVGEFYVFPYTLLHGVYPFNSTDEKRRTLSYNCDLIKKLKNNPKEI